MGNLISILKSIDWHHNIDCSLGQGSKCELIDDAAYRIAVWANQLEAIESGNPALSFVREMQQAIQNCCALIGLCLYKPSAASARNLVECCMYYTYFRSHVEELTTLVANPKFFVSKSDITEYHKLHTIGFNEAQDAFGLINRLNEWYSRISAIIHGQIPGVWSANSALRDTSFDGNIHNEAVESLLNAVSLVNDMMLCTVGRRLWPSFSPDAKTYLIKGVSGQRKSVLKLDQK